MSAGMLSSCCSSGLCAFPGEETEAAAASSSLRPWVGPGHSPLALHWDLGSGSPAGTMAETSVSPRPSAKDNMAAKQPPPLMKKHSQTDLVSRLKTRKILGVGGEDDDGEVHRSKISQVLGNEIKFAVREPLGLRVWQFLSAMMFSSVAIMALALPDQLYDAVFDGAEITSKTPIRLYGGALLSISLIMWNALYTAEKVIIRWTLLTEACYFGVQSLVVTATLAETGLMSLGILLLLASRLLFVLVSIYYYYQVGRKPKKV
ncbi:tumor protein p53-inducible protein 11 isoform X2 [Sigmodon hispidus]